MKTISKTIVSLFAIIIFLTACFSIITIGYFGAWLHTYRSLTEKRAVAELVVSSQKKDSSGDFFELTYTPLSLSTALNDFISGAQASTNGKMESRTFKIYGDQFWIGGPIVKFHDNLILLNFKTVFKVGEIGGRYNNLEKEKSRSDSMFSIFEIDNGYSDWRDIQLDLQNGGLKGALYNLFIDSTQLSSAGKFISAKEQSYTLFITSTGFFLDEL